MLSQERLGASRQKCVEDEADGTSKLLPTWTFKLQQKDMVDIATLEGSLKVQLQEILPVNNPVAGFFSKACRFDVDIAGFPGASTFSVLGWGGGGEFFVRGQQKSVRLNHSFCAFRLLYFGVP